jgi:hypothetical protein
MSDHSHGCKVRRYSADNESERVFEPVRIPARTHWWILAVLATEDLPVDALAQALAEKIVEHRCRGYS